MTVLENYRIGRFVLSSLCVVALVRLFYVVFVLQADAQDVLQPEKRTPPRTSQDLLQPENDHHLKPVAPKLQHTTKCEQDDRCGNSSTQ